MGVEDSTKKINEQCDTVDELVQDINYLCDKWIDAKTSWGRTGKNEDKFYSDELSKQIFAKMVSAGFNSSFWTWADQGYV